MSRDVLAAPPGDTIADLELAEARAAAIHPTRHRTVPLTRTYPAQMSTVQRLRNPVLEIDKYLYVYNVH